MTSVILLYASWCHNCPAAKQLWRDLGREHDFDYQEIDAESEEGQILVQRYDVMGVPTTIIDGEVAFVGIPGRKEAISKIT